MKKIVKSLARIRSNGLGLIALLLFSSLTGVACQGPKGGTAVARDTSVSAFIQDQLSANPKDITLHFPHSVKRFYESGNGQAAWVKEGSDPKQTWQAMMLLDCVLQYGLTRDDYHPKELLYNPLHTMLEEPGKISNRQKARFDVVLTDALITFMNYVHYGKLNPFYSADKLDEGLMLPYHAEDELARAKSQQDFMSAVISAQPKGKQYAAMQDRMRLLKGQYQEDCYNVPESEVRKIAINMERLRWAGIDQNAYIQVNIPSYTLKFYQPDTVYEFKVVVGKPSAPTPVLNSSITYLTTSPEWKIPQKIFINEIIPKALLDISYLENSHFAIYDKKGNYIQPTKAGLTYIKKHPDQYYGRQSNGCDNALGQIVFRFANAYDIYLHDTPEQQLFKREERAFSHSCIRVEQAQKLAQLILTYSGDSSKIPAMQQGMKLSRTKNISFKKPVAIKITYLTCEVKEGLVITYKDIYNLDKGLEMSLYNTTQTLTMK